MVVAISIILAAGLVIMYNESGIEKQKPGNHIKNS